MILRKAEDGSLYRKAEDGSWHQYEPAPDEQYELHGAPKQDTYKPDIKPEATVSKRFSSAPYHTGDAAQAVEGANQTTRAKNAYEASLVGDKEAQQFKKNAQGRNFFESMFEGGKNVLAQMDAGTKQSPGFLPTSIQDILDYKIGGDNSGTRQEDAKSIDDFMDNHRKEYRADRLESPVATTLGELVPYLATGTIGERALINIGGKLSPLLKGANIKANKAMGNLDEASRIAKQVPAKKDLITQNLERVARGTATGGAEGSAEYDNTAGMGALSGGMGGAMGMISPLKVLDKVPVEGGKGHQAMIKELHREGFQITPGVRTGNRVLQTEEAGMRNSDELNQTVYNKIDEPNLARLTNMVGEAIGLETKGDPMFTQKALSDHMGNLSSQYKKLEASTTGKFSPGATSRMSKIVRDTGPGTKASPKNRSIDAKQNHAKIKDIFAGMKEVVNPDGSFKGADYQKMSQKIKGQIDKAYKEGNTELQGHLQTIKKELDSALESGMDKGSLKEWKDLNERFAMTNMVMENGIKASGKINPAGMTSKMMSKPEAKRTLTGNGGRVKKLQDVVRYSTFLDDVEGGSLTGLGKADQTGSKRGMLKRGVDYAIRPATLAKANYKLNTVKTPFVGKRLSPAHGISPTATVGLSRALSQAMPYSDLYDMLSGKSEGEEK